MQDWYVKNYKTSLKNKWRDIFIDRKTQYYKDITVLK